MGLFFYFVLHFNCKFAAQKKERPFGRPWLVGQLLLADLDPFFKLTKVLFICRFKDKGSSPDSCIESDEQHLGSSFGSARWHAFGLRLSTCKFTASLYVIVHDNYRSEDQDSQSTKSKWIKIRSKGELSVVYEET